MGDPNIIATLIPHEDPAHPLPPAPSRIAQTPTISSQKGVPPLKARASCNPSPHIQLTFRKEPRVPHKGYSFGTNPQGDVLLGGSKPRHISRQHFCITFDPKRNIVLNDTSSCGTAVSYGGQGEQEPRKFFTSVPINNRMLLLKSVI